MQVTTPIFHSHDILIIGAGGAGLMSAITARKKGFSVVVISKVHPTKSHTVAAQGGINAALGNVEQDDWRWHMYDTIKGSDWLADQDAVEYMCQNAANAVLNLADIGVDFSRLPDGKLYQRLYGGQSTDFGQGKLAYRACAAADQTGTAIITTLYNKAISEDIEFFNEFFAYELLFEDDRCIGVASWSMATGEIHVFIANQVIIATGGYGQVYRTTTVANICTGDGNALCALAGIPLQDMEFVQFHPTAIPEIGVLITEAARAEGAYLANDLGKKFMSNYSPQFKDLACRDVVARAIATEIAEGRGTNNKHVWLYLNHLDKNTLINKLPNLLEIAQQFAHCDPSIDPIPVSPAAHYTMGGIPTNIHGEVMPGLMAIGETACVSVHGANRLGCNSLLDIIVFAEAAINRCTEILKPNAEKAEIKYDTSKLLNLINQKDAVDPDDIRKQLQTIMQESVGMFRNKEVLTNALEKLLSLSKLNHNITDDSLVWNNQLLASLETRNLLIQAIMTCYAALNREESRGAHSRTDFPSRNNKDWLKHSLVTIDKNYTLKYDTKSVNFSPKDTDPVPLDKRKY
jgi:succinate dehydrogenase / fumarate reductase, flavoprotein subunit